METKVDLITTPEMDKVLFALAKENGTTYRRELSRTLARAADSVDRLLLAAAEHRLEEVRGKPTPIITEVSL